MPQKNNVCECDQDDFFDQCVPQRINGMVDERAAVVKWNDSNPSWQSGLQVSQLLLDRLDNLQRICAIADYYDSTNGFLAAVVEYPSAELRPELDRCHIAHVNGRATAR